MKDFELINHIKTAVAVIDKNMKVVFSNAAFKQRNNLYDKDISGIKCFTAAYKLNESCTHNNAAKCPVAESFQTKKPSSAVHHFWVEDHAVVEVISTTPIIESDGEVKYVVEEFYDMNSLLGLKQGILTICSYCKKVRNNDGEWISFDVYLHQQTGADFSHGVCECCKNSLLNELK